MALVRNELVLTLIQGRPKSARFVTPAGVRPYGNETGVLLRDYFLFLDFFLG